MIPNLNIIKVLSLTSLSFILAISITPLLTHFLFKYRLVKSIRQDGKTPIFSRLHKKKEGTPTMGGVLIWGTVLLLALVFYYLAKIFPDTFLVHLNFITRKETLLPLGAFIASALVGLLDDWFNITRQGGGKGGGLTVKHRLFIFFVPYIICFLLIFFYKKNILRFFIIVGYIFVLMVIFREFKESSLFENFKFSIK